MWKKLSLLTLFALLAAGLSGSPAAAQASRTWVSGVGDDANPCSRTAPCKTFAGAIAKTAAPGEIDCLDPGGFGGVTITKSIIIDCSGTFGSVLVSGTNGITVAAGATDVVILRGLSINGFSTGTNGINFLSGAQLSVERCLVFGFTQNAININTSTAASVYITNTYLTKAPNGINFATTQTIDAAVDHVYIMNVSSIGITSSGSQGIGVSVTNSVINNAVTGVNAGGSGVAIVVDSSTVTGTNNGFFTTVSGATIRVSNNNIYENGINFNFASGGTIASSGNNRVTPSGSAPNGTITQQ